MKNSTRSDARHIATGVSVEHLLRMAVAISEGLSRLKYQWSERKSSWDEVLQAGEGLWGNLKYVEAKLDEMAEAETWPPELTEAKDTVHHLRISLLSYVDPLKKLSDIVALPPQGT